MTNLNNYSKMESEEIWQIIDYLMNLGLTVTHYEKVDAQLKVTLTIPLLLGNSISKHT